jgi:SAM-dependent methyltransferase
MPILDDILAHLRPAAILDVGCGCGTATHRLSLLSPRLVAVDIMASLAPRWRPLRHPPDLEFACMDARRLAFGEATFPLVLERVSLHHIEDWEHALDEMIRVSSDAILIEEPVDDLRTVERIRTFEAQGILLELQREIGYSHFLHLTPSALLTAVGERASIVAAYGEPNDAPVSAEEFFRSYDALAARSARPDYWRERRQAFQASLGTIKLCEDDHLVILASKRCRPKAGLPGDGV